MNNATVFEELKTIADQRGVSEALEFLVSHFRSSGQHHQLFEALKMKVRLSLGLPLLYGQKPEEIDENKQRTLEDGLLNACREVGAAFVKDGKLREGWMYLQPLGDRTFVKDLMEGVEITVDTIDDLIDIGLSQGAAPELAYRIVLSQYGTCNAITTFDTQIARLDKPVQKRLAAQLVDHIYRELVTNVGNHIQQHEKNIDLAETTLRELTSSREWLTANGAHHIDTTHLASIMRIGRIVDSEDELVKLLELAEYGGRLDEDFQYAGSPPFENTYPDHLIFYHALLGHDVEYAIRHFRQKIATTDELQFGTVAIEYLIELLVRVGRSEQALQLAMESLLGKENQVGIAPNVFEIAKTRSDLSRLSKYYREQNDLLGYSVGMLQAKNLPD